MLDIQTKKSHFIGQHGCFSKLAEQLCPKMFLLRLRAESGQFSALGDCSKDDFNPLSDNGD